MRRWIYWGSAAVLSALVLLALSFGLPGTTRGPQAGTPARYTEDPLPDYLTGTGATQEVKQAAESVSGVQNAWPAVSGGNDVIVGVELSSKMSAAEADVVEQRVVSMIEDQVPWVDEIEVTSDPERVAGLRNLWAPTPGAGTSYDTNDDSDLSGMEKSLGVPGPGTEPGMEAGAPPSP